MVFATGAVLYLQWKEQQQNTGALQKFRKASVPESFRALSLVDRCLQETSNLLALLLQTARYISLFFLWLENYRIKQPDTAWDSLRTDCGTAYELLYWARRLTSRTEVTKLSNTPTHGEHPFDPYCPVLEAEQDELLHGSVSVKCWPVPWLLARPCSLGEFQPALAGEC